MNLAGCRADLPHRERQTTQTDRLGYFPRMEALLEAIWQTANIRF